MGRALISQFIRNESQCVPVGGLLHCNSTDCGDCGDLEAESADTGAGAVGGMSKHLQRSVEELKPDLKPVDFCACQITNHLHIHVALKSGVTVQYLVGHCVCLQLDHLN